MLENPNLFVWETGDEKHREPVSRFGQYKQNKTVFPGRSCFLLNFKKDNQLYFPIIFKAFLKRFRI